MAYGLFVHILVVEDQAKIASFVKKGLEEQGMVVDVCDDGDRGFEMVATMPYDAVVLDIMLPGRDGLSILRHLRERKNSVPVLLLTARDSLNERVEGLNLGADDYLTKPFFVEELVARLRTIVRRSSGQTLNLLKVDDLTVDLMARTVTRAGDPIELTAREFELLEYMMRSPGRVYTRIQICEHVWNYHFDPQTNLVDVYIKRLRKKIDQPYEMKLIHTVRGVGYRLGESESSRREQ